MAENPQGYWPDLSMVLMPQAAIQMPVDRMQARSLRQQRRKIVVGTPTGTLRRWVGKSNTIDSHARADLAAFLKVKGGFGAFYFFEPAARRVRADAVDGGVGSVSAATRLIIPYRSVSISDIRVAGVSQSFTVRHLVPRNRTYVSLRFNGSTQWVDCGSNSSLRTTGNMTCAAWVFTYNTTLASIMGNGSSAGGGNGGFGFFLDSSRRPQFNTFQSGTFTSVTATPSVPSGVWTHVAAVRAAGTVTFYINGVAVAGGGATTNPTTSTRSFRVGDYGDSTLTFDGMISGARYYTTNLSATEIANIYNENASPDANLKGHWKLIDGMTSFATTPILDSSGYGNTGTTTGSPVWVGGEDEIVFGSSQTGAVTMSALARERIVAVYDGEIIPEAFYNSSSVEVTSLWDAAIQEVY